ncbi:MAG: hypothetical protein LBP81_04115 [Treponema sp.]|nr:hypothetical protein [Treponema sp.]
MVWQVKFFLLRIALPAFLIFAGCDTAMGKGSLEPEPVPGWEFEPDESSSTGNPFLGKDWVNDEGFIYTFGVDGTIFVEHHCGLEFDNQFSYLIWKNILVIYGTEMDNTDTLKAGTMTVTGDSVVFTTTGNETITYTLAGDGPAPAETGPVLDNVFIGNWQAGNTRHKFTTDGTLVQTAAGKSAEYSYLVRKDRLVTLSREAKPLVREYRFEKNGNTIMVNPMGGGSPLIYTPYGE